MSDLDTSPLEVRDGRLVVHGRRGEVVTFPTTGKGAVAALAPFRYSVGRVYRGDALKDAPEFPPPADLGTFTTGRRATRTVTYHRGVALLDRDGWVLHRLYGLPRRDLRRFAAAHGLDYWGETLTDREALEAAPELLTGRWAGLPLWMADLAKRGSTVIAVIVAIGVFVATRTAFHSQVLSFSLAGVSLVAGRLLLGWAVARAVPRIVRHFRN
jgi:hypothetical protein